MNQFSYYPHDIAGASRMVAEANEPDSVRYEVQTRCPRTGETVVLCDRDQDEGKALARAAIFCSCLAAETWVESVADWSDHTEREHVGGFEFDDATRGAVRY